MVTQNHQEITCLAPSNVGVDFKVYFEMFEGSTSNAFTFNYDMPDIRCPDKCGVVPNIMNAQGGILNICGRK
jgi:hypothetical protein